MSASHSENRTNSKTKIAYILLIIDVALFFLCGHSAVNSAASHVEQYCLPESMYLTVSKDIDSIVLYDASYDDMVHVKTGTVVLAVGIQDGTVLFYFSETGKDLRRFKGVDRSEWFSRKERGGWLMLRASVDCFEEKEQLEAKYKEAIDTTKSMRDSAFKKGYMTVIIYGVCLLALGLFFTYIFSTMEWHTLLYVVDIIGFFVILYVMSSLVCR